MRLFLAITVAATLAATANAQTAPAVGAAMGAQDAAPMGLLVMAHGGTPAWNASVEAAIAPLQDRIPAVIAFGMADPHTLEEGIEELAAAGVERVAVVRLLVSGQSFLSQTLYLLGLSDVVPRFFVHRGADDDDGPPEPIRHELTIATHADGLDVSDTARRILGDRALELSRDPARESVLLLAHGMGKETENDAVLKAMSLVAETLREMGFAAVEVATLREDWPEERKAAEAKIRGFVSAATSAGARVLVIPFRLSGFGPYAEVLDGLEYVPGHGLLPHPEITRWIEATAAAIACEQGWPSEISSC